MRNSIRKYSTSDLPYIRDIYRKAIRQIGNTAYSKDQVAAWSSFPEDTDAFRKWVEEADSFVATDERGNCIGFGGWEKTGRISALFVHPGHMRKGVGSMILSHLIKQAEAEKLHTTTTEASEFSKPLFEKYGFTVVEIESTEFKNVKFQRYVMQYRIK